MTNSQIRFTSFPKTKPPPPFVKSVIEVFKQHESVISSNRLKKGLESNAVLAVLSADLVKCGFSVESGKGKSSKLRRPVFFGEGGESTLLYEIDAYHEQLKCGLEVEAGRAILGNAIFRDLFQAMVMVDVNHLCLAVPNTYKYKSKGKQMKSSYYDKTIAVATALYGHTRMTIPYELTVIGY